MDEVIKKEIVTEFLIDAYSSWGYQISEMAVENNGKKRKPLYGVHSMGKKIFIEILEKKDLALERELKRFYEEESLIIIYSNALYKKINNLVKETVCKR